MDDDTNSLKDSLPTRQTSWRQPWPNAVQLWKTAYRDLKTDFKKTRWLRGFGWIMGGLWFCGLIISVIMIGMMSAFSSSTTACQPDGSFRLHPETYNLWSSSGFFQITLGGGRLTFTQAKVIDIVWDIFVGRGGQFALAFVSLKVFRKYLTICMETRPITYHTFRTIFFQHEASLPDTYGIIKSFWRRRLESKIAMAFMTFTMIFILLFPTLASAMSGYDANVRAYLPDDNGNFVPFKMFKKAVYVIHDASRLRPWINQTNDWNILHESDRYYYGSVGDPVSTNDQGDCHWHDDYGVVLESRIFFESELCGTLNAFSTYVAAYGLGGLKNQSSTLNLAPVGSDKPIQLGPPTLNISKYHLSGGHGYPPIDGADHSRFLLPPSWSREDQTSPHDETHVEEKGSCQTIGDYQWGFSFLQLFLCVIFLFIWTVGIYIMWRRAHRKLGLRETSGTHRAVLELAAAMQDELDIKYVEPSLLSEKQLEDRVENELKGGRIRYAPAYPEINTATRNFRKLTKDWFKREKWWFTAIVLCSALSATLWLPMWSMERSWVAHGMLASFWCWSFGLWGGLFFAMCIGTTNKSKALITVICSTITMFAVGGWMINYIVTVR